MRANGKCKWNSMSKRQVNYLISHRCTRRRNSIGIRETRARARVGGKEKFIMNHEWWSSVSLPFASCLLLHRCMLREGSISPCPTKKPNGEQVVLILHFSLLYTCRHICNLKVNFWFSFFFFFLFFNYFDRNRPKAERETEKEKKLFIFHRYTLNQNVNSKQRKMWLNNSPFVPSSNACKRCIWLKFLLSFSSLLFSFQIANSFQTWPVQLVRTPHQLLRV